MTVKSRLAVFFWAALGAVAGHLLVTRGGALLPQAFAYGDSIRASQIEMVDGRGRRRLLMATSAEGSPGVWLFDDNGKARLNLALYGDGNATVVLNDPQEQAVQILRSVGPEAVPVLVQKAKGQDRVVMGLQSGEPSLVTWSKQGKRELVFGK